jgi:CheY-like chemotaxis protein
MENPLMSSDAWIRLFGVIVSLLQAISWPLIVVFILLYLRAPLTRFLDNIIEVTLKAGPIETSAKRKQIEAAASLGAATVVGSKQNDGREGNSVPDQEAVREITDLIGQAFTTNAAHRLDGVQVLWVDDIPANNLYERLALEATGIRFTFSTSTETALKELQQRKYYAIISDMGRPGDPRAGYTLLEKIRAMNITIPFIIYAAGGNKLEHQAEAKKRGAYGSTNDPQTLFELVIAALSLPGQK